LREELKAIKLVATEHFFRTGEILKEVRDDELWKAGWHSFESYFADPDLGMKTSTVYHGIKLVETFAHWKKLVRIPVSKLVMIAPHVDKENMQELIGKARELSRSDLRHELLDHGLEPESSMKPPPKVYSCRECGGVKGVSWDGLCHCGLAPTQIEYIGKLIDKVEFGGDI
ncbi:hypothetical protein KA005_51255, partial [bacterium]|nr:hypothetical protein [bacterium]